jgi:hypothetical protein
VKDASIVPAENVLQTNDPVTMSLGVDTGAITVPQLSAVSNPLPVIVTAVLTGPKVGLTVIVGPKTVKTAEATSVTTVPVSVITCTPGAAPAATVNDAVAVPLAELVQDPNVIIVGRGLSDSVHPPATSENPLPVIVTMLPRTPEPGLTDMLGAA